MLIAIILISLIYVITVILRDRNIRNKPREIEEKGYCIINKKGGFFNDFERYIREYQRDYK